MISLAILFLGIFFNSIMDADSIDVFGKWAEKRYTSNPTRFNFILWHWVDVDSWENKYMVREWMIIHGFQPWFATWMAKDVLVVFLDLWHFAKALMMLCFSYPIAMLSLSTINDLLVLIDIPTLTTFWWWVTLFFIDGIIFNFFYYNWRKLS